jgi:hypothetical protein
MSEEIKGVALLIGGPGDGSRVPLKEEATSCTYHRPGDKNPYLYTRYLFGNRPSEDGFTLYIYHGMSLEDGLDLLMRGYVPLFQKDHWKYR